ncbi:MAG: SEC-C domain-containing protein [Deltaproteobacteria bacterium]|nr:SEC-C domain-containing protein [Deltaproteobacteria bacterium]
MLVEQVRAEPTLADFLGSYGDPRAVPVLLEELDRYPITEGDNPFANHALIELRAAIEMLGGTLTDAHQRKCARGADAADRFRRSMSGFQRAGRVAGAGEFVPSALPALRPERPGRNEPCWCGSGKKYKKCHLAADEAGGGAG